MFSYEGKRAIVTGAGRGIGRAIALAFARQGADVALVARTKSDLESTAKEIRGLGRRAWVHTADMTDIDQAVGMVDESIRAMGGVDLFVNNAGGIARVPGAAGPLFDATPEAFDAMVALNLRSPLFAALRACRHMAEQKTGGAVLNIVSIDGVFPAPTEGLYGAAKAAMVNLTQVLCYEMGPHRIRVNAIAPGVIETSLTEAWLKTDEQRQDRASFYPLGRFGKTDDIANAALYLCSDEAEWVSGVVLLVTGGSLATSDVFRWTRKHNPVPDSSRI
jgi:NAD(P)-dependent dehydrogenase (short-subunit alcohol dehydrogenase family)